MTYREIEKYENELDIVFPKIVKDFLSVMNGTDLPAINIYGSNIEVPKYSTQFYSYLRDLDIVKSLMKNVYSSFDVDDQYLIENGWSRIFPVFSHRFLMIDSDKHEIISIYYDDAIAWEKNIIALLENEILKKGS